MDQNKLLLYELSRSLRSLDDSISISSSEFGEILGVSQQTGSRLISDLERAGLIKRERTQSGQEITLTRKGVNALKEIHSSLDSLLSKKKQPDIVEGTLVRGLGEGAYYVKEYASEISRKLGFEPFLGTLNIRIEARQTEDFWSKRRFYGAIKGFRRGGRTFGAIRYTKVRLRAGDRSEDCFLILPSRTHYRDVLEIISHYNLRQKLELSENQKVSVEFI